MTPIKRCGGGSSERQALLALPFVLLALWACAWIARPAFAETGQKTAEPTLQKQVSKDGSSWAQATDLARGREASFRLACTFPQDLATLDGLAYYVVDRPGSGLAYVEGSVVVELRHADGSSEVVTERLAPTYASGLLSLGSPDIKAALAGLASTDKLLVSYRMRLSPEATAGLAHPNENAAQVLYGKPGTPLDVEGGSLSATPTQKASVYTWALRLRKLAADSKQPLAGATFRIRAADGSWYGASGWTKSATEAQGFVTDAQGTFTFTGLDSASYTLVEAVTPKGYAAVDDMSISIAPQPSLTGADGLEAKLRATKGQTSDPAVDAAEGLVAFDAFDPVQGSRAASTGLLARTGDAFSFLVQALPVLAGLGAFALAAGWLGSRGRRDRRDGKEV